MQLKYVNIKFRPELLSVATLFLKSKRQMFNKKQINSTSIH